MGSTPRGLGVLEARGKEGKGGVHRLHGSFYVIIL